MREFQVRICERLGVKFPGPTRRSKAALTAPKSDFPFAPDNGLKSDIA